MSTVIDIVIKPILPTTWTRKRFPTVSGRGEKAEITVKPARLIKTDNTVTYNGKTITNPQPVQSSTRCRLLEFAIVPNRLASVFCQPSCGGGKEARLGKINLNNVCSDFRLMTVLINRAVITRGLEKESGLIRPNSRIRTGEAPIPT